MNIVYKHIQLFKSKNINGKLFLYNSIIEKDGLQKIVVFEKKKDNNEFNQAIITLKPNEKIKDKLKEIEEKFKNKTIEEIINDKEFKENIKRKEIIPEEMNNFEKNKKTNTDKEEQKGKNVERKNINNSYQNPIQLSNNNKNYGISNYQSQIQLSNNNINYFNQINDLKNQLNEEKKRNKFLFDENNNLKNTINNLKNENYYLTQYQEKNKLLQEELNRTKSEIQNLMAGNFQNKSEEYYLVPTLKPGEKIIAINFVSMGIQDIGNFNLICKNTDLFIRLEERLYNEFPRFKNYDTFFEVKGKRIKRFKTIKENKIENNDIINIFIAE